MTRSRRLLPLLALAAFLPAADPPPAAVVDAQPMSAGDLQPALAEAAGGMVLEETILDRLIARELAASGASVTAADLERERTILYDTITDEAGADEAQAGRLLEQLRRGRGLGPRRFAALLSRNAGLRKLVASRVTVTGDEAREALSLAYGPSLTVRLIVVRTQPEALEIRSRLADPSLPDAPDPHAGVRFAEQAFRFSIDSSAPRGGLLAPVHLDDPSIPSVIRHAIADLPPGQVSPVLTLDSAYALALVEGRVPALRTPTDDDARKAEARLRRRKERQEMDRYAASLLAGAKVTVFDDSLRWSWESARTPR